MAPQHQPTAGPPVCTAAPCGTEHRRAQTLSTATVGAPAAALFLCAWPGPEGTLRPRMPRVPPLPGRRTGRLTQRCPTVPETRGVDVESHENLLKRRFSSDSAREMQPYMYLTSLSWGGESRERGLRCRWRGGRGGGDHRRHSEQEMAPKRTKNGRSSRADGDSMGPSALDGKNGVACDSVRKPPPCPIAVLRASPLATPTNLEGTGPIRRLRKRCGGLPSLGDAAQRAWFAPQASIYRELKMQHARNGVLGRPSAWAPSAARF